MDTEISWYEFGLNAGLVAKAIRNKSIPRNFRIDKDTAYRLRHMPHKIGEDVANSYKYHYRRHMVDGMYCITPSASEEIEQLDKMQAVLLEMIGVVRFDQVIRLRKFSITEEQSKQFSAGWDAARLVQKPAKTVEQQMEEIFEPCFR